LCQIVWSEWLICFLGVLWHLSAPEPKQASPLDLKHDGSPLFALAQALR